MQLGGSINHKIYHEKESERPTWLENGTRGSPLDTDRSQPDQ